MKRLLLSVFCLAPVGLYAQYAPQAGVSGSTAVAKNSGSFTGWATACDVKRGYLDIADPSQGYASSGLDQMGTGIPDNAPVSLGDSGVAVLTFSHPIYNGAGPDFAVFENGFANPQNAEEAFLELAFVEVSSDGQHYVRFDAASLTPALPQIPVAGVYMDARKINNLAGKYIAGYGTPFDLEELKGKPGLDVNNITHVRLVDVIGAISNHTSLDTGGNIINDPYPSSIPTGGFDLDAVGAFYQKGLFPAAVNDLRNKVRNIYPNPAAEYVTIDITDAIQISLTDITGRTLQEISATAAPVTISLAGYVRGIYYIQLKDATGNRWAEKIIKY